MIFIYFCGKPSATPQSQAQSSSMAEGQQEFSPAHHWV